MAGSTDMNKYYNQALIAASIEGHHQLIECLVTAGADVNITDNSVGTDISDCHSTPLVIAARHGHKACVETLVRLGADVNKPGHDKSTALMMALDGFKDDINCATLLIESGANVNAVDTRGESALFKAARKGYVSAIKLLLESGAKVDILSQKGTPLLVSSSEGHVNVVRILVESGASVNQRNDTLSPLMIASLHCNLAVIRTLIEYGAEVNDRNFGITPLSLAVSGGHILCIEDLTICYLEKGGIFPHPVGNHQKRAAFNNNRMRRSCLETPIEKECQLEWVQLLLASGADVNHTTKISGWTALMIAALDGHVDIIKLLLNSGARVNTVMVKNGWSALASAVVGDHYECTQLLLQAGADVNAVVWPVELVTFRGKSALGFAADTGDMEIIKLLLQSEIHTRGVWPTSSTITEARVREILKAAGVSSLEGGSTDFTLQAQCRHVIRQHLLKVPPSVNLFVKVARLCVPSLMQRYLLYNTTLD